MDQVRQAGRALDAAVVPPVPSQRSPAAAERLGVQPGQSVAAARPADADRYVVAHQSPAAPRQDGRATGQARPLLLAPAGREPPDPAAVRVDAPADLGAARADGLTGDGRRRPSGRRAGATRERCPLDVGIGAPAATIQVAWRALRREIHWTRMFHTSAV